jgi:hypothetical protein
MGTNSLTNIMFIQQPKPFEGDRGDRMEVLVGGLDHKIYEVEKGHHLNWVRKYLPIPDNFFAKELAKQAIGQEKTLPENFYELFPTFVRILVVEKSESIQTQKSEDGYSSPESMAYFETKSKTPDLKRTVLRVLRMFKHIETIQLYTHDSRQLESYSRREYLLAG